MDLRCGVSVAEVAGGGVRLADGEVIEADEILVAVGSLPNTEWLGSGGSSPRAAPATGCPAPRRSGCRPRPSGGGVRRS
ncbi:hypothetical protein ACWC09_41905 [Streptomyces sp. NPDC001617]